jgi:hypothetical protein
VKTDIEELLREGVDRLTAGATVPPGLAARVRRRERQRKLRIRAAATAGTAAAAAAAVTTATLVPGGGTAGVKLAAWTVAKEPGGTVAITLRELRDPAGLRRALRADGVPARVTFVNHPFEPATNGPPVPPPCRAPSLSDQANAELQGRILPPPVPASASGGVVKSTGAVVAIRPSAIPPGIGLNLYAWVARRNAGNGDLLDMEIGLVDATPQCTGP